MSEVRNIFDVGANAMSAQLVRMNTLASNIANAGAVSGTSEGAYRTLRPVFETIYSGHVDDMETLATMRATEIVQLDLAPEENYSPEHPLANEKGMVFASTVNVEEEIVEMMEASRQYQNTLEVVSTMRTLMARTVRMGG